MAKYDWQEGGTGHVATEDTAPVPKTTPGHWVNPTNPFDPPHYVKGGTTTQTTHPEAKALHKAGISPDRLQQLGKIHMIDHPAIENTYVNAQGQTEKGIDPSLSLVAKNDPALYNADEKTRRELQALAKSQAAKAPTAQAAKEQQSYVDNPSTPEQWAKDILIAAGFPDTASNEALVQRQMTEEGMPGSENNPLATTLAMQGSSAVPGNPDNVQEYPSTSEGVAADAAALQNTPMAAVLQASGTPQQYAAALEQSNYEGLGGSSNPANVAYGQAYLGDQPATSFPGGGSSGGTSGLSPTQAASIAQGQMAAGDTLGSAGNTNFFSNLNNLFGNLSPQNVTGLQQALQGLNVGSNQSTLAANTTNAPGSPDQTPSQMEQTQTQSPAQYQALLQAILGNKIQPGGTNG